MIEPLYHLYDKHNYLAAAGVYHTPLGKEFGILITSFTPKPVYLSGCQPVAHMAENPVSLTGRTITHGKMLGVVETNTVYKKRNKSTRDIHVIKKHLGDARKAAVSEADEIIDTNNVKLRVGKNYYLDICNLLPKHNELCEGRFGNTNITQHQIELIPGARPFQ